MNGAIINSFLATVWKFLPKKDPVRVQAALLEKIIKRPVSNFDGDASGALWAYKAAIERSNGTRAGINTALETKLRGLVTPAGKIFLSKINHTGLQMGSMWVGRSGAASSSRSSAPPSRRRSRGLSRRRAARPAPCGASGATRPVRRWTL